MPTGSCMGATTVRARVSASTSRLAPARMEAGISRRRLGPHTRRQACGTIRPTKPMLPPWLTAVAVRLAASSSSRRRRRASGTPSVAAWSPCSASRLMAGACHQASSMAGSSTSHGHGRSGVPEISPTSQNTMPRSWLSCAMVSSSEITAPQAVDSSAPVSSSSTVPLLRPKSRRASQNSTPDSTSAPATAARSTCHTARPSHSASRAPTEAPPDTPIT